MASKKPKRRTDVNTSVLYVRVQNSTADRVRVIAATRGYPHTIASVASEMMDLGVRSVGDETKGAR